MGQLPCPNTSCHLPPWPCGLAGCGPVVGQLWARCGPVAVPQHVLSLVSLALWLGRLWASCRPDVGQLPCPNTSCHLSPWPCGLAGCGPVAGQLWAIVAVPQHVLIVTCLPGPVAWPAVAQVPCFKHWHVTCCAPSSRSCLFDDEGANLAPVSGRVCFYLRD